MNSARRNRNVTGRVTARAFDKTSGERKVHPAIRCRSRGTCRMIFSV
jgi:hypothetical protein